MTTREARASRLCAFLCLLALVSSSSAWAAFDASQVLILVNRDVPVSGQVAQMYQRLRAIPAANLLRLSMGTNRYITPEKYWSQAGQPVRKYLEEHPDIRCVLTTAGVPYTVIAPDGDEGAAFDNELAAVLREEIGGRKRRQPNPLYLNSSNPYGLVDPRLLKMVYVARLDGPDLATITRMVEDAVETEKVGLTGIVAADAQGLDSVTGYGEGDATIRAVADRLGSAGFPVNLDMKMETWKQPPQGAGNQADGAAFYVGWYSLLNFQDIFGTRGLARGSIAWHIASLEAQDIWNPGGGWCVNLMKRGAAVTLGPVREPYVEAFPHGDIFTEALLKGLTVVEGYWLSLPHISWAMMILGDPLYRPFAAHPKPAIIARAYISAGSNHILVRGETNSLLVQLECVGAPGSSIPALMARVEPESGLAAASGTVVIPALKAGESVVVRIPSVTAGEDSSGMFRLRLMARGEGEASVRRIVVEGRIGFSRLTGGLGPKTQMFPTPDGSAVIAGLPGRDAFINTSDLRNARINLPEGIVLANASFAPDGTNVAMVVTDPKKSQAGVIIVKTQGGTAPLLPAGTQFLRWLDNDHVGLIAESGLLSRSISGGPDRDFGKPPGKLANLIPGTEIQYSSTEDGRVLVKNAAQPYREVLAGTQANRVIAIANDLSLFGGLDAQNQLWVQFGFDAKPEVIATGVASVLWGPISRRVLVRDANLRARLYDGRTRSWQDLGIVQQAEWSSDEESLLFVEPASSGNESDWLSLLSGKMIQKLCPTTRLGPILKMTIADDQKRAFLLASLAGQADVWMMPLPPRVPAPPKAAK